VVSRKAEVATLANSIVFNWCNGKRSTIEEALKRNFKKYLDLSEALIEERDDVLGPGRLEEHIESCRDENVEGDEEVEI
jgi:hypothetical protein